MGLRVTGDQSLPVRSFLENRNLLTQRSQRPGRGMKGFGIQGLRGGPIPPCAVTAKANLPRRWVFRLIAEARINNAVALQRQPYLGVECFD